MGHAGGRGVWGCGNNPVRPLPPLALCWWQPADEIIKQHIAQLAACPLHYRLGARALRRAPRIRCDTLYAVGGLYGNSFALSSLLERANRETLRTQIVFNGDFNFLNCTPAWWRQINSEIRHGAVRGVPHVATLGNVEAEAATEHYTGCGCGYPSYTSPGVADRSDQIVRELHACAHAGACVRVRARDE